jgi:hypothetical protein
LAAEFTSAAAPRTVLHAATATDPPINMIVISFRNMLFSPALHVDQRRKHKSGPLRYRNFLTAWQVANA